MAYKDTLIPEPLDDGQKKEKKKFFKRGFLRSTLRI